MGMFHMFLYQYYNIKFYMVEIRQFTFLCNIMVFNTDFNKSQTAFRTPRGNSKLTLSEELCAKQRKYTILQISGHQAFVNSPLYGNQVLPDKMYSTHTYQYPGLAVKYWSLHVQIKADDYSLPE